MVNINPTGDTRGRAVASAARLRSLAALVICAFVLIGCEGPSKPATRVGSLPYPGPFSLYESAEPQELGAHHYGGIRFDETSRGIIYTERGGFIDIAHLRITVDWTWYYYRRVHAAIEQGQAELELPMNKPSQLLVKFNYPDDWAELPQARRETLIQMLSIRMPQELAWTLGAWHEIATWHGYSSWVVIPEDNSAFTYDDTFSHLLGLLITERVIQSQPEDYERAVGEALKETLGALGAQSAEQTDAAAERVRGRWWTDLGPMRRYLNLSLNGEPQRPWLVPDKAGQPGRLGEPVELPRLHRVGGRDFSGFYEARIEPNILEATRIRQAAGTTDSEIDPARHFPAILATIRAKVLEDHGPDADQP